MSYGVIDRVLTVVVTATITSAAWVVLGPTYFTADPAGQQGATVPDRPAPAATNPADMVNDVAPAAVVSGGLQIPVAGVTFSQLSDTFAQPRGGGTRPHEALDIMAPVGTPVLAAAPGTIEKLHRSNAGGNTIYLRSTDRRMIYYFAHLEAYAAGLKEGQQVSRGQRLGTVGSTGNASPDAPHLHFAMLATRADAHWYEPATAINPYGQFKDVIEGS
jgi:murein DD-endopeptidase MepM/ murein hydrolase activator NlpD